jgi:hypothetical protein
VKTGNTAGIPVANAHPLQSARAFNIPVRRFFLKTGRTEGGHGEFDY